LNGHGSHLMPESDIFKDRYAIVTPSFAGDLERCELLVESVRKCSPGWNHYIIVDRHDVPKFRALSSNKTIIMDSREIMDSGLKKAPGRSGIWLSMNTLPVRGWMTQQIRKLGISTKIDETNFLCCDSDTVFLKNFNENSFLVDQKLGLLDVNFCDKNVETWTHKAEKLLGLPRNSVEYRGHVGMLILWNRNMLQRLQEAIEENCQQKWQIAIARHTTFSEYITYGVFVRSVVGYENSPHAPSTVDLVKTNWGQTTRTPAEFEAFFSSLSNTQIAAMVHSKDGISVDAYRTQVENAWRTL